MYQCHQDGLYKLFKTPALHYKSLNWGFPKCLIKNLYFTFWNILCVPQTASITQQITVQTQVVSVMKGVSVIWLLSVMSRLSAMLALSVIQLLSHMVGGEGGVWCEAGLADSSSSWSMFSSVMSVTETSSVALKEDPFWNTISAFGHCPNSFWPSPPPPPPVKSALAGAFYGIKSDPNHPGKRLHYTLPHPSPKQAMPKYRARLSERVSPWRRSRHTSSSWSSLSWPWILPAGKIEILRPWL